MKRVIRKIIILLLLAGIGAGVFCCICYERSGEGEFAHLRQETADGGLLELYRQNSDLIGWISISGTGIDYPVMKGDQYLYRNFRGEYSESGTPFVTDIWTAEDKNTLIFGHNMWVQGNMFNPLHKYEKKRFLKSHGKGIFRVIRKSRNGKLYVEERAFDIANVVLASKYSSFPWHTYTGIRSEEDLRKYEDWCRENALHSAAEPLLSGNGAVSLCTCSYHIKGRRHDGRLIVTGSIRNIHAEER